MNYLKKNFPIFLLSGSLIFVGLAFSPSAQGAKRNIKINYVTTSQYGCGSGIPVDGQFFNTGYGSLQRCTLNISQ